MARVPLPTGSAPNWELTGAGTSSELKSIADSLVVLQSLRQSRDQWLSSTFPKFSTRSRSSKLPEVVPPPHSITFHGRCDLEIGPHIFRDTAFFEVRYLSQAQLPQHGTASAAGGSSSSQRASTPLISALASNVSVTPALVAQVNKAAQTNPALAHLVYLAASNRATPEQLKTLGLLIQSMATGPNAVDAMTSAASQHSPAASSYDATPPIQNQQESHPMFSQEFELVFEFKETHLEKLIFPRVPVVCKRLPGQIRALPELCDVSITTSVPFPNSGTKGRPQLVNMYLRMATVNIWELLCRWVGDEEKMRNNQRILDQTVPPERAFLGHRMPEGEWLKELRAAAMPEPLMKPLKPSAAENIKQRRKSVSRKQQQAPDPPRGGITKRRASEPKLPVAPAAPPIPRIACLACNQNEVPLLMGGRYCHQCIEAGRATSEIPVTQDGRSQSQRKPTTSLRTSTLPLASSPLAMHPPVLPQP
ncbi:hypothetical protein OE88DRAFT_1721836 [Heliocybe sulcata]|uniref:Uncharacterized protein n=1 Tax=Heliocybe sulcata TaxID=5364 RepID=A0A5C3NH28_9AGAM|nr:hypothetical protein OE88DRAFT_1721836 [Heliocybe sulcata]